MKIHRIDHMGINVNDLPAAKAFFLDLGLELQGEGSLEGAWLDRIVGLNDVKTSFAFLRVPDGQSQANIELIKYHTPSDENGIQQPLANANTQGIRHIAFAVEDIEAVVARLKEKGTETFSEMYDYEGMYKLCYIRGPEGIILELAEQISWSAACGTAGPQSRARYSVGFGVSPLAIPFPPVLRWTFLTS